MNPALTLVVLTLAAFRVTRLLIEDTIIDRPRSWVERRFMPHGGPLKRKKGHLKALEFMGCPFCIGHYVSLGAAGAGAYWMGLPYWFACWWAISAGQAVVYVAVDRITGDE